MTANTERIFLRARFWSRYFRWAITFQLGWALLLAFVWAMRCIQGGWWMPEQVEMSWVIVAGVLALFALAIAVRRRNLGCAEITPIGIRPYTRRHGWGWGLRYPWAKIYTARLKAGPFGNRWLEVMPLDDTPFKITARPSNPDAVLDALERFAGPDHPLTLAMAEVVEAGR